MKNTKEFIKKPKVIIAIGVAILSFAIIALLYSIYVNDEPAFIPEETKETVRGAIKEGIAEPIMFISKPLGEKISNAAWTKDKKENPGNSYGHTEEGNGKKDTKNWPTYTDPETGVSIKYPEGISVEKSVAPFDDYIGTVSFWGTNDSIMDSELPVFDIDIFNRNNRTVDLWLAEQNNPEGMISEVSSVTLRGKVFTRAIEAGAPDHVIFVSISDQFFYKFKASIEDEELLRSVLETFDTA